MKIQCSRNTKNWQKTRDWTAGLTLDFSEICTRKNYKDKIDFGTEKRGCTDPWCGRAGKFLLAFPNVKIRGILSPEGSLGDIQERGGEQDRHVGCSGDKKVCAAKSD